MNRSIAALTLMLASAAPVQAQSPAPPAAPGPAQPNRPGLTAPEAVKVDKVWARATPQGADVGAVYFTLTAQTPDRLIGASTPAAARAEVHEMGMDAGVMHMREVRAVMLPANQAIVFGPGGYHVMLMGLKAPLKPGQSVPLRLTFATSPPVDATATVQSVGARAPAAR